MQAQAVEAIDDPRVAIYRDLSDPERLQEHGCFLVEGRANVACLVSRSRFGVKSLLLTPTAWRSLREELSGLDVSVPIYTAAPETLRGIAGFNIHRGALALGEIDRGVTPAELKAPPGQASLVVALEQLSDPDNVGSIFRSAVALGSDGILLDSRTCDPLYRKAIRVSMGGSLCLPFARAKDWLGEVNAFREAGYAVLGLHPDPEEPGSVELAQLGVDWTAGNRVLLVLGNEGSGLSEELRGACDRCVRIDMARDVDSLNVATAAAIALYMLSTKFGKENPG